jgi:hypothetical protein
MEWCFNGHTMALGGAQDYIRGNPTYGADNEEKSVPLA